MAKKSVKSYQNFYFESSCYRTAEYIEFEKTCRSELKKMAKINGFNLHSFSPMHFEFSAVLERDGKYYYVSIRDVRFFEDWYNHVLVRTMAHEKDWTGGYNNYCAWDEIPNMLERISK